jgi:hypothetical protein
MFREENSTCFENSELTVKLSIMCVFMLSLFIFRFLFRERKIGVKVDLNIDRNPTPQDELKIELNSIKEQNSSDDYSKSPDFKFFSQQTGENPELQKDKFFSY